MTPCKAAKKYARAVNRHLICSAGNRARLMELTQNSIHACLEDTPEAGFSEFVREIGEPKAFAESLLEGIPPEEIKAARKFRKYVFRAALAVLAIIICTAFVLLAGFYLKYQDAMRGDFIVSGETLIIQPENMTPEEFKEYTAELYGIKWEK